MSGTNESEPLAAVLQRIAQQYERSMSEVAVASLHALTTENQTLTQELKRLRVQLQQETVQSEPLQLPGCPDLVEVDDADDRHVTAPCSPGGGAWRHDAKCLTAAAPPPGLPTLELNDNLRGLGAVSRRGASPPAPGATDKVVIFQECLQEAAFPDRDAMRCAASNESDQTLDFAALEPVEAEEIVRFSDFASAGKVVHRTTTQRSAAGGKLHSREGERLRDILGIDAFESKVTTEVLYSALCKRTSKLSEDQVKCVVADFNNLLEKDTPGKNANGDSIPFWALVDLMFLPDVSTRVRKLCCSDAKYVLDVLHTRTVDELITEATRATTEVIEDSRPKKWWEEPLNYFMMVLVTVDILVLGISIDTQPNHRSWLIFDAFCVILFVGEVIIKNRAWGPKQYFCGPMAHWNVLDFTLTLTAALDLCIAPRRWISASPPRLWERVTNILAIFRILRLLRIMRLLKLMQSLVLTDLASMLAGFMIGMSPMFWVLFIFVFIIYVSGVCSRIMFGPAEGTEYLSVCGPADDLAWGADPNCLVHLVYGDEYFGSVTKAMFTSFRFMLGDYSTKGGKSLAVALSDGYGFQFDLCFMIGMIIVVFGLFNIITAVFIDSTVSGLKHNEIQWKYEQQYEANYVKDRLRKLFARMQTLNDPFDMTGPSCIFDDFGAVRPKVEIGEEEFYDIMKDREMKSILRDLDIEVFDLGSLFDTLDADGSGTLSMQQVASGIMKVRGEPRKMDIIASWVAIRALHKKFEQQCLRDTFKDRKAVGIGSHEYNHYESPSKQPLDENRVISEAEHDQHRSKPLLSLSRGQRRHDNLT